MSIRKQFFAFLLLGLPILSNAQIFDQDSVFFLENMTLELGKNLTGKNKNKDNGFTWRISSGFLSRSFDDQPYNTTASVIPLALGFGYRFRFLELGFRHSRTGISLGTDVSYVSGPASNAVRLSYPLPSNVGIQTNSGVATLHFVISKIPLFVNMGIGRSAFLFSDRVVTQNYYANGTSGYIVTKTLTPLQQIRTMTTTYGIGFSKGSFFGGLEWWHMRANLENIDSKYRNGYQNMFLGLQMSTSRQKRKVSPVLKDKKYVMIGFTKLATMAPWRHSGTGSGWSADLAVNIKKRAQLAASFQFKQQFHGYEKSIPDGEPFYSYLSNPAGAFKRHLLYGGYALNPDHSFKVYTYAGLGYYRIIYNLGYRRFPEPDGTSQSLIKPSGGVVIGGGFQYKYIHSQVLFHNTFVDFPMVMEWNLGGRLLF